MTDYQKIAEAYVAAWNETDAGRRVELIANLFAANYRFADPMMTADSHSELDALIAGIHERFPGFRFHLDGPADGFADRMRLSWTLGPEGVTGDAAPVRGTDFATLEDGRIIAMTGFYDRVPDMAA